MASTRNKNTRGDYLEEDKCNRKNLEYRTYEHSQYGKPKSFLDVYKLPNTTLSTRPIAQESMSHNHVDIESYLRGISATDLEREHPKFIAELKEFKSIKLFDTVPLIMPKQTTNDQGYRPLIWNN